MSPPMTTDAAAICANSPRDTGIESAIRIAVWNACKARGMSQDGSIQLVAQTLADPNLSAALRSRDALIAAEEACPLCEGKPLPAGMGCIAGCRDGVVLVTSANVLRNVKPLLERTAGAIVEWEVWQDDMPVATSTSEADALHYLMVYGQDGPVKLIRVERTEIVRAALQQNDEGEAA